MRDLELVRRTAAEIVIGGVDITRSIRTYLKSVIYTDNEADEADDLQILLHDRDAIWGEKWLADAIEAASAARLSIGANIIRENWNGDGRDILLPCGSFELDSVVLSGPPAVLNIKSTSLPFSAPVRQSKKNKAWENIRLSAIAGEIASTNGMACMFESAYDPFYSRVEQLSAGDIDFLARLCRGAGISLKATRGMIVLFDQVAYEAKSPVVTIKKGGAGSYIKYKMEVGAADAQYASCRVSYVDPESGRCIEATARIEDYNAHAKNNQQFEVTAKVSSGDEAKALAEKYLRLHNRYAKTAVFTLPGTPALVAGVVVEVKGWGAFDGRYIVSQAVHTVGEAGYTTQIKLRRVLEGY